MKKLSLKKRSLQKPSLQSYAMTLGVVALGLGSLRCAQSAAPTAVPDDAVQKITAAAPSRAPVTPIRPRRLLVFTLAKGFVHSSIPYGARAMEIMGRKTGAFTATVSNDPAMFDANNLRQFDALCLVNTTGDFLDTPERRQNLLDFVRGGKGLVGIHAATDAFYNWPEYGQMIGGYFSGHPWNAGETVGVRVEDKRHPINAAFNGRNFKITDEIYQFKEPYARTRQRVLLSLDMNNTERKGERADDDYPVSWIKNFGQGRVFYCSLGHREDVYWNPAVLRHYLAGIQYAMGDLRADATPVPQPPLVAEVNDLVDAVMGEYAGVLTAPGAAPRRIEAKVIAEGGGNYRVVLMSAATATMAPTNLGELTGRLENGALALTGKAGEAEWSGTLANGQITITQSGAPASRASLRKTARRSPSLGMRPPRGAVVLLPYVPGVPTNLSEWTNQNWMLMDDGSVQVRGGDNRTKREFGDMRLHLEFMTPLMTDARGQGRGNSGVYLQDRYEVQVLDSFGLPPKDNEVGGIYTIATPKVNAGLPPGQWQTYDMLFRAPRLDAGGNVVKPATVTILLNGIVIHENQEIPRSTGGGAAGSVPRGPIRLQDHGDPVRYRNIWVVELKDQMNTAQRPAAMVMSVNLTDVTVSEFARMVAEHANVDILVSGDVKNVRLKAVRLANKTAEQVLQAAAMAAGLAYSRLDDRTFAVARKGQSFPTVVANNQDGWRPLFNGRDLSGWRGKPDGWKWESGALALQPGGGDIWSEERFGNFILDLEFKTDKDTNSGVFIRTDKIEDWLHTGIEIQVYDSFGKEKPSVHDAGAVYDVQAPSRNTIKAPGEWNRMTITARDNIIQVVMNGEQIVDMDLNRWTEAHKNPDGTPNKFRIAYKDMKREGHLGFQDHGRPVWYRNVRIKKLP